MSCGKVYVCCEGYDRYKHWEVIYPLDDGFKEFYKTDEPFLDAEHSPEGIQKLRFTSTAVWQSKIYFLGGQFSRSDDDEPTEYSTRVYAFDTTTSFYDNNFAPMGTPRNPFVSVAVAPGKIYVFGGAPDSEDLTKYGECYDIKHNSWSYLAPPPEQIQWMGSYAVYESTDGNTRRIFFLCTGNRGLVTLDLNTDQWMPVDTHSKISKAPFWNDGAVAVVGDVLIWLHRATIYAHDFIKDETFPLLPLGKDFPFNSFLDVDTEGVDPYLLSRGPDTVPSFLFHVGDSRLCLIWDDGFNSDFLHCCSFLIKNQEECLGLELEHLQEIQTPCSRLLNVALVLYEV